MAFVLDSTRSIFDTGDGCFVQKPIFPDVVISFGLFLGTQISFIPQIAKLIMRKDIEGVSLITFFFGTLSCSAVLLDGVMTNWPRFHCCKLISSWKCFQSLLSFLQLFVNWFNYFIIFFLIVLFVQYTYPNRKVILQYRMTFILYTLWCVIGSGIISIIIAPLGKNNPMFSSLGIFWAVVSTSTIILQWVPQIWTTWKLKSAGSLSLITLCINAPGSFLNFIFMIRSGQSPGTYLPYFFSGFQQLILVVMLVIFMCKKRKQNKLYKQIQMDTEEYAEDDVMVTLLRGGSSSDDDLFESPQDFVPQTLEEYRGH